MFVRPGYTFEGWNSQASGNGMDYTPGASYTYGYDDETIYAQWKANEDTPYRVEHYLITPQNECVLYQGDDKTGRTDSTVQAQPVSITGYEYKASYQNDDLNLAEKSEGKIAGDGSLVLKLYYTPLSVYLNYNANNGTDQFQPVAGYINGKVTVIGNPFSRPGYTFIRWTENRDGSGKAYEAGKDEYTFTKELDNLYAQWQVNTDISYTVEHYILSPDEKSCTLFEEEDLKGATDATAVANPIYIAGYEYAAGYQNETLGVSEVSEGTITADGNLTLKLYYKPHTVSLVYMPNGGTGTMASQSGYVEDTVIVSGNLFTREGYSFDRWNTKEDGTGVSYSAGNEYTLTAVSDVLYAVWTPNDDTTYTVKHYKVEQNGGAELADTETLKGTTDTMAYAAEKTYEGYTFVNQTGDKQSVVSGKITGDGSLILKLYYVRDMDTLKYMPNGGTGNAYLASGPTHEQIDVLANLFIRFGYKFKGWNTQADGSGTAYQPGDPYLLTDEEDILYAQWAEDPDSPTEPELTTLTYKANGGAGADLVNTGAVGAGLEVSSNPFTRHGYLFKGWNTRADGSGIAYDAGEIYLLTAEEDILYAQWEKGKEEEPEEPEDPDEPDDPSYEDDPSESVYNEDKTDSGSGKGDEEKKDNPGTGDAANILVWFMLLSVSAAAMSVLIGTRRKRG
ncbi:MAG: InlB B-repeat-containing protein, partial [Oscillospiraceae bacterium]